MNKKDKTYEKIIEDLRLKYEECFQTLNAIKSGDVDAIVVRNGDKDKIYSLKDSLSPYKILLEKMNEGAATISTEGLIFYCNRQLSNMLEIPIEKLIGGNIDNFIKKSDYQHFMFFLKNLENKEGKIEVEMVRKSKGKAKNFYIPVLVSGNFLIQDGIKFLILILTNLTEQKHMVSIQKSEWFSRIVLEQSANIILITDLCGNVLRANTQAIEILAKQKEFLPPNWHIDMFLKYFRLVNGPKIEPVEFSLLSSNKIKNGSEIELYDGEINRNFLISYNSVKDNKRKLGYSISLTEITELKIAEEKILSLSKFPSEDPNPIFRVDKNLNIIYLNKPGEKILNYLGITVPLLPKKISESLNLSCIKNANNLITTELKIGRLIYEFTIVPVKNTDYFNIYGRDVTLAKKAERTKLRIIEDKILQMERKKIARELHDNVSQSIFSSSLFSESILNSWAKDSKSNLKNLKIIRDLNYSALSEIRNLLSNMMPERFANTNLKILIKRLLNTVEDQSGIKTDMIFQADHELNSSKIKKEIYHIVQESLNNITKHSKATSVKVIVELDHNKFKIIISDNGIGFDLKDKSVKRKFGLNIMRERVRSIGASINIDSSPNNGTKITILKKN